MKARADNLPTCIPSSTQYPQMETKKNKEGFVLEQSKQNMPTMVTAQWIQ